MFWVFRGKRRRSFSVVKTCWRREREIRTLGTVFTTLISALVLATYCGFIVGMSKPEIGISSGKRIKQSRFCGGPKGDSQAIMGQEMLYSSYFDFENG
jgi:hypothetical protein